MVTPSPPRRWAGRGSVPGPLPASRTAPLTQVHDRGRGEQQGQQGPGDGHPLVKLSSHGLRRPPVGIYTQPLGPHSGWWQEPPMSQPGGSWGGSWWRTRGCRPSGREPRVLELAGPSPGRRTGATGRLSGSGLDSGLSQTHPGQGPSLHPRRPLPGVYLILSPHPWAEVRSGGVRPGAEEASAW